MNEADAAGFGGAEAFAGERIRRTWRTPMASLSCGMMMAAVRPQRTSAMEKLASSAAITTSQAAMNPVPPPKQAPCTSATVGTGAALSRQIACAVAREMGDILLARGGAHRGIHLRSAPAWKCRPRPLMTTARKPARLSSASSVANSAWINAPS